DAHALGRNLTGNEVYVRNLLAQFSRLSGGDDIIACVSRSEEAAGQARARLGLRNPFKPLGLDLAAHGRHDRPDLLHVQYTGPLFGPVPVVATIHDVSFLEHPEFFPAAQAAQLRITVARTARRAAHILTPSEFSRGAILGHYRVDSERVMVVPNG